MDIERVLDDYRNGDEGKRISLFLAYRDLHLRGHAYYLQILGMGRGNSSRNCTASAWC